MTLPVLSQSPTDPGFVQSPYAFYERARAAGPFFEWADYGLICTASAAAVSAVLKDRRLGREVPAEMQTPVPAHLAPFYVMIFAVMAGGPWNWAQATGAAIVILGVLIAQGRFRA